MVKAAQILEELRNKAVQKAQTKVSNSINKYFRSYEVLPSVKQYIADNEKFLSEIWQNEWNNAVNNATGLSKSDVGKIQKYATGRGVWDPIDWVVGKYTNAGSQRWEKLFRSMKETMEREKMNKK